jgi:hypothetical protein
MIGNNIDTLKTLPDKSVDCCVTSPPYYDLRDYGTAVWVGGDPACNHFRDNKIVNNATFQNRDFNSEINMLISTMRRLNILPGDHVAIKKYTSKQGVPQPKKKRHFILRRKPNDHKNLAKRIIESL